MDISIVIPCYNEVDNVTKICDELLPVARDLARTKSLEIVFVDDGCTDGTIPTLQAALAKQNLGGITIKYADNHGNYGLGKALRTGFAASTGNIVITTDSDGTYQFAKIPEILSYLKDGVDIVTASPYHPKGGVVGVPGYRLFLSQGSSFLYRVLVNPRIHTYTALFRAYRREVIENIHFETNTFMAGTALMVKAMLKGYKVVEYPAVLYRRVFGVSKAKLMQTIRAHLGFQWSVLLYHLRLLPFDRLDVKAKPAH